jgi:hypothetical protein
LEYSDLPLSDASLLGFSWSENGQDLLLSVQLGNGLRVRISFAWASDVTVEIRPRTERCMGPPLTIGVHTEPHGNRWRTHWDFGDEGALRVEFDRATCSKAD